MNVGRLIASQALGRGFAPPPASGRIVEVGAWPLLGLAAGWLVSKAGTIATVLGFTFGPAILEGLLVDGDVEADAEPLDWTEALALGAQVETIALVGNAALTGPRRTRWDFATAAARKYIASSGRTLFEGRMAVRELEAGLAALEAEQAAGIDTPAAPVRASVASVHPWAWLAGGAALLGLAWYAWGRKR